MKIFSTTFAALLLTLLTAYPAYAAQITTTAPASVAPNAPFTITVSMTTDANAVNVVQGAITIPAGVVVDHATTAGSQFTLWPTTPQYSVANGEVIFSGGTTRGIPAHTTVELFTIEAHAIVGTHVFMPKEIEAYQDNGKGTPEPTTLISASVNVQAGGTSNGVSPTGTAQPLVATIGQDPSLFGDKYFVTFYGGDRGTGVMNYEVQEGNGPFVSANRYYVLEDQTLSKNITVRAMDAKGIAAQVTVHTSRSRTTVLPRILAVGVLIAALCLAAYLRMKRRS